MKRIVMLGILFIATSCVTTKIISNKSSSFNDKITKLFIMVKGADDSKSFFFPFISGLRTSLKENGAETEYYYADPLSLESESDIAKKIKAYNPKLIMVINQTEARRTTGGGGFGGFGSLNTGGTFDVKIFKPNSDKPVWRANLKADGEDGLETSAKKAYQKLIEKLIEDNLL